MFNKRVSRPMGGKAEKLSFRDIEQRYRGILGAEGAGLPVSLLCDSYCIDFAVTGGAVGINHRNSKDKKGYRRVKDRGGRDLHKN